MKNIVFTVLAIFVFMSCSKDENDFTPADGQYVADAMDIVVSLVLENGTCTDFVIYVDGKRFDYTPTNIDTKGHYPKYTYSINGLSVLAHFNSTACFSGVLDGVLRCGEIKDGLQTGSEIVFNGENPISFVLDNAPLDADGDGYLDSKQ